MKSSPWTDCTRCGHPHHAGVCWKRFVDNADAWDTCICPECRCPDCQSAHEPELAEVP
jgi:hypothetical protein